MRAHTKEKHGMGKRSAIVVAGVLAMIVSVVGWATAGTVGAQTPSCLPTSDRTVGPHGFAGLGIKARAPVYTDALQFAAGGRPLDTPWVVHEADALTSEGFVSGISQAYTERKSQVRPSGSVVLSGDTPSVGYATVVQLESPEQAQAEMNRELAGNPRRKRFTVPAIPGSQGVLKGGQNEAMKGVRNAWDGVTNMLFFTDGDYSYAISRLDAFAVNHRLASRGTKQVTKAAINLYNRVHGAAVCP